MFPTSCLPLLVFVTFALCQNVMYAMEPGVSMDGTISCCETINLCIWAQPCVLPAMCLQRVPYAGSVLKAEPCVPLWWVGLFYDGGRQVIKLGYPTTIPVSMITQSTFAPCSNGKIWWIMLCCFGHLDNWMCCAYCVWVC